MHQDHNIPWKSISENFHVLTIEKSFGFEISTGIFPKNKSTQSKELHYFINAMIKIIKDFATTERKKYPDILTFPKQSGEKSIPQVGKEKKEEGEGKEYCDIKLFPDELLDQLEKDNKRYGLFYRHEEYLNNNTQMLSFWIHSAQAYNIPMYSSNNSSLSAAIKYLIIKNQMTPLLALGQNRLTTPIKCLYSLGSGYCFGWNRIIACTLEAYIYFNILGEFPEILENGGYKRLESFHRLCRDLTITCDASSESGLHIPFLLPPVSERIQPPIGQKIHSRSDVYRDIFQDMEQLKMYLKSCFEVLYRSEILARECGIEIQWDSEITEALRYLHVDFSK